MKSLNRYALELIEEIAPYTGASPYIFGVTRAMSPPKKPNPELIPLGITAMPQAIRKNRKALDIADFCSHDLRRTSMGIYLGSDRNLRNTKGYPYF